MDFMIKLLENMEIQIAGVISCNFLILFLFLQLFNKMYFEFMQEYPHNLIH